MYPPAAFLAVYPSLTSRAMAYVRRRKESATTVTLIVADYSLLPCLYRCESSAQTTECGKGPFLDRSIGLRWKNKDIFNGIRFVHPFG